jgi:hypothetical protein
MASKAQIAANRRNARRSTGPQSAEGKAQSRGNALRHGLTADEITVFDEDPAAYDHFADGLRRALAPADEYETMLVERIAAHAWRMQRAARLEARILDDQHAEQVRRGLHYDSLGAAFCGADSEMATLSRYEATLERALHRAQITLERRQAQRRGEKVLPPIAVQVEVVEAAAEPAPTPAATPSAAAQKHEITKRSQFAAAAPAPVSDRGTKKHVPGDQQDEEHRNDDRRDEPGGHSAHLGIASGDPPVSARPDRSAPT